MHDLWLLYVSLVLAHFIDFFFEWFLIWMPIVHSHRNATVRSSHHPWWCFCKSKLNIFLSLLYEAFDAVKNTLNGFSSLFLLLLFSIVFFLSLYSHSFSFNLSHFLYDSRSVIFGQFAQTPNVRKKGATHLHEL